MNTDPTHKTPDTCAHRVKVRLVGGDARLWECVHASNNPGCGALFTLTYARLGEPVWTPADTVEVTR